MKTLKSQELAAADEALARSLVYRALAHAFAFPLAERMVALVDEDLPIAVAAGDPLPQSVNLALERVRVAFGAIDPGDAPSAFVGVFKHVHSVDAPLYETDMTTPREVFRQSQELADIGGFYRAFGMDLSGERPDHLSVELEFMHLLTYKLAWATSEGEREGSDICDRAQRSFLEDHLLHWAPGVAERVEVLDAEGPWGAAATLLRAFLEDEGLRLGVQPSRRVHQIPLTVKTSEDLAGEAGFCEEGG